MNKQQLASKIWASANEMRSKIEANEYKDYILGFIFYKFLSDKEESYLKSEGWAEEDLESLNEDDTEVVTACQRDLGYFISYKHLFSTWIIKKSDFEVSDVRDALSSFDRFISTSRKRVFSNILDTLQTGLSKLGDSSGAQTKAISKLLQLIKDIPTNSNQDYDVLGFIYEYLISNFAATAGKKAGEFYTPHEVSVLMSDIIAHHLSDRDKIEIYDPTSGSGSLLINIGRSVAKHIDNKDNIKYYAQELKENTYNLTRMNLIMRDIKPANIVVRNADTLEDDWPYFDDNDKERTYNPLYVDAVVSNPPYSQVWEPANKESDPRYAEFGLAPKSKADYAFLLHDLFHVKPDGIMTIVLPHGVLFRGGEEEKIRQSLIEHNNIDAIIGLPANIFFGTGIPTIIIVLRKKRSNDDVLIIDASKGFVKEGKNNKLRACDIKKIVDCVVNRSDVSKFSRKVSRQEIRDNDYNLNIPRYVDSSDAAESWDIYATMFGGIPNSEIDRYAEYWNALPSLRGEIFESNETPYSSLINPDVKSVLVNNKEVLRYASSYQSSFDDFPDFLRSELLDGMLTLKVAGEESRISDDIFHRLAKTQLIDRYEAYQILDDKWQQIATDLEIIQTEGFESTRVVDPNMVIKKKDNKDVEVQDGWIGRVIPFELVQLTLLKDEANVLNRLEQELSDTIQQCDDIINNLSEEDKERLLNDNNDAFVAAKLNASIKIIESDISSDEIVLLNDYLALLNHNATKSEKMAYVEANRSIKWDCIDPNKDGTYGKGKVEKYIKELRSNYEFMPDSLEDMLFTAKYCLDRQKTLKSDIKTLQIALDLKTKETLETLSDKDAMKLLELKWITPLYNSLVAIPDSVFRGFATHMEALAAKYATTLIDIENSIKESENSLSLLIDELEGDEFDMTGLREFQTLLKGE